MMFFRNFGSIHYCIGWSRCKYITHGRMLIAKQIYIYQNKTNVLMLTTLTGTLRYRNIVFAAGITSLFTGCAGRVKYPQVAMRKGLN